MSGGTLHESFLQTIMRRLERVIGQRVGGVAPDPESWPPPGDCDRLQLVPAVEKSFDDMRAWVLGHELQGDWIRRRTTLGAQAYRLESNGEYDCGWRLVSLAARFIQSAHERRPDLLIPVPRAQVFSPVDALDWCCSRLASSVGATYRPDLIALSAPLSDHPDRLSHMPVTWGELFRITRPATVFGKHILLCDWRWERGKSMMALSKVLRKAGAEVVCFAWMD